MSFNELPGTKVDVQYIIDMDYELVKNIKEDDIRELLKVMNIEFAMLKSEDLGKTEYFGFLSTPEKKHLYIHRNSHLTCVGYANITMLAYELFTNIVYFSVGKTEIKNIYLGCKSLEEAKIRCDLAYE